MEKTLIIYYSRYGATKSYVDDLCKDTDVVSVEAKDCTKQQIANYKRIIIAGSIHISKLKVLKTLSKYTKHLQDKDVYLLAVGLNEDIKEAINDIKKQHVNIADYRFKEIFYCPGKLNVNDMTWFHRKLFGFLASALKKQKDISPSDQKFLSAIENSVDYRDMAYLNPIKSVLRGE